MAGVLARVKSALPRSRGDDLSHFEQHQEGGGDTRFAQIRERLLDRRRIFGQARRTLLDRAATGFILVLIPERLPVLETGRAVKALEHFHIPVAGLVVNRVLPEGSLGPFLEARRDQERHYLAQIREQFAHLPQIRVPLFTSDVGGLDALREVARHLFPVG
jgi:arsenite-transporting ATPase